MKDPTAMQSSKPYLLRALYEWILDSDCTPHIVVNAMEHDVTVPQQYVKDGQIVLNIAPSAVADLLIDKTSVFFNARFAGISTDIYVPIHAVLGIYARENGRGMMFEPEQDSNLPPPETPKTGTQGRPALRVVK